MMANIHQLKEVEDCVERLEQLNQNENDLKEALRLVGEEKATVMKRENHLKHTTRYLTSYPKTNKSVPF